MVLPPTIQHLKRGSLDLGGYVKFTQKTYDSGGEWGWVTGLGRTGVKLCQAQFKQGLAKPALPIEN